MGRQIGFYMIPEDEEKFVKSVKEDYNVLVYSYETKKKPPIQIVDLPKIFSYNWTFFFYNSTLKGQLNYRYVKQQRYFVIDPLRSYVIEFSRCGPKDDLREGRLWAELVYWDKDRQGNDIIVRKSPEFVRWFNKITNWIRRNYENYDGLYFSPQVIQYLKEGGKVSVSGHKIGWDVIQKWKRK